MNYNKSDQQELDKITLSEAEKYLEHLSVVRTFKSWDTVSWRVVTESGCRKYDQCVCGYVNR